MNQNILSNVSIRSFLSLYNITNTTQVLIIQKHNFLLFLSQKFNKLRRVRKSLIWNHLSYQIIYITREIKFLPFKNDV